MKSITQIHVDVSTPKKAKKVAAILRSFPTKVNKIVLHRLAEGAVPYTRYALIGCVGRLQIWDFVKPSDTHEVISPKKLKKMLSEISANKDADPIKDKSKDIHDMIIESFGCPPFSGLRPLPINGVSIRKIDLDETKGIDFTALERICKLGDSFDRTETFMTDFAKKMAIKPILVDPDKAKSILEDLEKSLHPFDAIPFTRFYFSKLTPFQRQLIDPWKNTLFNFPLPPFKNVLKEWLKSEEEKTIAIKKEQEANTEKQSMAMPKIGDLVVAYDSEDRLPMVGILTRINDSIPMQYQVNSRTYWLNVKKITAEQAKLIYAPTANK
ncbi:hypothetical protein [Sphingobacterium sp. UGAL515B_05]|uniref:hypothetical protein n=1 Tax=Sphingobacterium sp. UGAL515B_05 TaxID=2986767 RepID=UPI002954BB94|nr:hypothetical protein [Sphingobacterium sp. UGAL515B_05]WON93873.1 hypothetical protein OK025_21810 [Sphingobacterium sp. UGAL515B_05]